MASDRAAVIQDGPEADLIRAVERERLRALVGNDQDVADRLHAEDFQLINPRGQSLSKVEYLRGIASGEIDYRLFEPNSDIAVRFYGQTALIRYQSQIDIVVGGRSFAL